MNRYYLQAKIFTDSDPLGMPEQVTVIVLVLEVATIAKPHWVARSRAVKLSPPAGVKEPMGLDDATETAGLAVEQASFHQN